MAVYILYEAYGRFNAPADVQPVGMLVVAVLGLLVNLVSMRLLRSGKDSSLNVKGAYLEVWADMLGSVGVIVAAIVIRYSGWVWVDTVVAAGIGLWVLPRTWLLLKESVNILLEGAPDGVDVDKVGQTIGALPGVTGVHDLHVWVLTSGKNALTAHVVHADGADGVALIEQIKQRMADEYKVFHTTLQLERVACEHSDDGCNFVDQRLKATTGGGPGAQLPAHPIGVTSSNKANSTGASA